MNTAAKTAADNKKKMDDLTVGLCALTVVGVSATAATPFWPAHWGQAPSIGVVGVFVTQAVGYTIAWCGWWMARR